MQGGRTYVTIPNDNMGQATTTPSGPDATAPAANK
jgi:hypothetical protein